MRQLTESAVNEVVLDGQNLPLCRGEVRNLEHGPEPDVLPAMHGSSGAIADRADSISSFKLRSARHAPLRSLDATTARVPAASAPFPAGCLSSEVHANGRSACPRAGRTGGPALLGKT
jgi:hypothetical protein